uniref:Uncharacterized protein n=1 Tax=Arundo donax TaxID=35708 RepID=A0A0A9CHW3_ARUDO
MNPELLDRANSTTATVRNMRLPEARVVRCLCQSVNHRYTYVRYFLLSAR